MKLAAVCITHVDDFDCNSNYHFMISTALRTVKLLATVMSDPSNKEIAMLQLQEWLSYSNSANPSFLFIAAVMNMIDDNIKGAIKLLQQPASMEGYVLKFLPFNVI